MKVYPPEKNGQEIRPAAAGRQGGKIQCDLEMVGADSAAAGRGTGWRRGGGGGSARSQFQNFEFEKAVNISNFVPRINFGLLSVHMTCNFVRKTGDILPKNRIRQVT